MRCLSIPHWNILGDQEITTTTKKQCHLCGFYKCHFKSLFLVLLWVCVQFLFLELCVGWMCFLVLVWFWWLFRGLFWAVWLLGHSGARTLSRWVGLWRGSTAVHNKSTTDLITCAHTVYLSQSLPGVIHSMLVSIYQHYVNPYLIRKSSDLTKAQSTVSPVPSW